MRIFRKREINEKSENKGEKRDNGCGIERNPEKKGEHEKKRTSEKEREMERR